MPQNIFSSSHKIHSQVCLMRHAHGLPNVIRCECYRKLSSCNLVIYSSCQCWPRMLFFPFRLLDFFERSDSFILILSRPSNYKVSQSIKKSLGTILNQQNLFQDLFDYISEFGDPGLDESISHKFFSQVNTKPSSSWLLVAQLFQVLQAVTCLRDRNVVHRQKIPLISIKKIFPSYCFHSLPF